jgi:hypothetical protein
MLSLSRPQCEWMQRSEESLLADVVGAGAELLPFGPFGTGVASMGVAGAG